MNILWDYRVLFADIKSLLVQNNARPTVRTYKLSFLNMHQWANGQPNPIHLQIQQAMFYPNAYINFNQNGEYTKHYYNGTERIASRLGNATMNIAATANARLNTRSTQLEDCFRNDIRTLVYAGDIPMDMPPEPVSATSLQQTGTPDDIFYYHTNHLSSTAYVTDNNATVTQGFLYAPFGEITTEFNANFGSDIIPKYSFNAKELDEETGMYYYEARYYKPPVFTSRDPLMSEKPWLTPYHYCSNNPVGRVDPSGCEDEITWVKKENGAIVFNSDVHDQADAESYYGENAECLYIGFQYKTKSGKECKLLENGYYLENGIKKKAPNEAPLFKKIGNAIKRFDEGGSYDGANTGTITPKDWKVGFAVVGVFAGAGATVETVAAGKVLSAVVSGLGTANCIDDACVNSEGKTPLERCVGGDNPSWVYYTKAAVDAANVGIGAYGMIKKEIGALGAASTCVSTISTTNKIVK